MIGLQVGQYCWFSNLGGIQILPRLILITTLIARFKIPSFLMISPGFIPYLYRSLGIVWNKNQVATKADY